jgi:antitoxin component of RelBE/YafQ-DinJ toxin-antitoxin module
LVRRSSSSLTGLYMLTSILPKVYTFGMSKYAVINLKTDPKLKKLASETASKLGVSISAVLNNELRRFATEQSVVFDVPEVPNVRTAKQFAASKRQIDAGDYHKFNSNKKSLEFLAHELK